MTTADAILQTRHAAIADCITTRKSSGSVPKVEVELGVVRAGFLEAAGTVSVSSSRL